ncbi:hypothetical protein BC332_28190 [Capsicum chinense]|nr:hypothetical protein BC332_28190 [Capsicum chinense]
MCWDDCDILHEKPTGVVRVSFGYMSIFEDSMVTPGLGVVVSYALAKEGYYVVLAGRSLESLSKIDDICIKAFQFDLSSCKSLLSFKLSLEQWLLDSDLHCSI